MRKNPSTPSAVALSKPALPEGGPTYRDLAPCLALLPMTYDGDEAEQARIRLAVRVHDLVGRDELHRLGRSVGGRKALRRMLKAAGATAVYKESDL